MYQRNEKVFKNVDISLDSIVRIMQASLAHLNRSFESRRMIEGPSHTPATSQIVKRNTPPPGVIKLNNNGASCGGVYRYDVGKFMLGFASTLTYCLTLVAEINAIHLSLSCAVQHQFNKLIVETDS